MNMDIRPLRNEADYNWALTEIERYFTDQPEPGSPEAARFDVLSALIEAYEAHHWSIEAPDPVSAIRERMNLSGYTQTDLATLLGSRSRASELLSGRRGLTMEQAWKLYREWNIPAEMLLRPFNQKSEDTRMSVVSGIESAINPRADEAARHDSATAT